MKTESVRPARSWSWLLAAASTGLRAATAARAETPPAETGGIEEVIVTAQKRSESLQTVPVSITALTASQLEDVKMDTPSDLISQVPNLQVNGIVGEASPVFSLRGISMFDYSLSQSSPVASYIDEVYKGNFVLFGVDMYDLERIEVLRGPQGTLYGKNTTGGAINFITHKPGFDTDGYLTVGVGNYSRQEAEGALQGSLVDNKLAARVAFSYTKADGWFHNVLAGYPDLEGIDQYGVRVSLLFKATDDLTAILRWSKSHQNPQNYGIYDIICRPGIDAGCAPGGVGGSYYRTQDGTATGVPLADDQIGQNYTPKRRQENQAVALTIDWNLSESLTLTSISSWDDGNLFNPEGTDGAPIDVFKIPYTGTTNQVTQDLRLTSRGTGPFGFIAGAYYQHEDIYNSTENQFFTSTDVNGDGTVDYQDCAASGFVACVFHNQFDQLRNTWALYTDDSYALTDQVKLRAGLRYNHDNATQKNAFAQMRGVDGVPIANIIPGSTTDLYATARQDITNVAWTGRAGVDYTPVPDLLLYANYSRGYRSGAFNAQFFFSPGEFDSVKPETVDSVEGGIKSTWLNGKLQADGAIFHYVYKNQQLIDVQSTGVQPLINIPESKVTGAELELVARPLSVLTVRGGLGLLDGKFTDGAINNGTVSIVDNKLPNAPTTSATLAADWDAFRGDRLVFTVHGDLAYASEQYFEPANLPALRQGGYTTYNARLALHTSDDRWEVAAWGRNLGDKFYLTTGANLAGFGYYYTHRNTPRTYGLEATYRMH
jgi:iron complex outermembrane receptor protein